ncbi:porin family protein [Brucella intermedia GD04153]|uniref:Porin family protein n=1 Tax=Brucella intermedia GD04153 TaxID=2975438 RepID=A0AA42H275_9HYPH|nr:porin family protein [Brucella intermedia]MDH0126695.1 porin family protein [Brucella intermedia GD04153]
MKRILFAALIAGAWANTAIAETFDWSGIYGGVSVGARWSDMDYNAPYRLYEDTWSTSGTGISGGGFVGYNFTYNNLVFGPEISAMFSNADGDSLPEISGSYRGEETLRTKGNLAANFRAGYAIGRVLPFVTVGFAKSWYDQRFFSTNGTTTYTWTDHFNRTGWNIGAGTDWAVTNHIFARAEYRYFDMGEPDIAGSNWSRKFKQHVATLGIGYKF